jgi:putative mRNA 3-end processing factor
MAKPLLEFTDRGIYCAQGNFYIDPWKPVDDAVITHAHADHAYVGHKNYLAHHLSKEVLYYRLGEINLRTIAYGETVTKNGVQISMFPGRACNWLGADTGRIQRRCLGGFRRL